MKISELKGILTPTVVVAALGYFVDMFDLTLFGVVRVSSLAAIGVTAENQLAAGIHLYNIQMLGMVLGGILWGILSDKRGRLEVLFGSIILYSIGNIANSFVHNLEWYAVCRFITGIGLAGELGAGVALVAETLPKEKRGLGTTFVATLGMGGAVAAALTGQNFSWKVAYILGGCLGLSLLFARFRLMESKMFIKAANARRGDVLMFLKPERFRRYLYCIMAGIPIYFITGILMSFSPEITRYLGVEGVTAGNSLLFGTIGLTLGDMLAGLLSQILKSRKKAIATCLAFALVGFLAYLGGPGWTAKEIYFLCFFIGTVAGYWAVLITVSAEQFGTNLRGTVATSVPNFVRGSAILITTGFMALKLRMPVPQAVLIVGLTCFTLAFLAIFLMRETFGRDLDFYEE
jgi:putative MFS transporter